MRKKEVNKFSQPYIKSLLKYLEATPFILIEEIRIKKYQKQFHKSLLAIKIIFLIIFLIDCFCITNPGIFFVYQKQSPKNGLDFPENGLS